MHTKGGLALGLVSCMLLASCGPKQQQPTPPPQLPSRDDLGYFCGMIVSDHKGPKSQIFLAGLDKPLWFTSVRDGIAFTLLPEESRKILALFVTAVNDTDWDHPEQQLHSWISADQAWFVLGSSKRGGMGAAEAIPFTNEAKARHFTAEFGGEVLRLAEIPDEYILGNSAVRAEQHSM